MLGSRVSRGKSVEEPPRVRDSGAGLLVAALVAVVVGCSNAEPSARLLVDTVASGTIHVSNPGVGTWGVEPAWRLVEMAALGGTNAQGPEAFGRIVDLAIDSGGRAYVLDQMASDIRVFDQRGTWIRTIGRSGQGPGEFGLPSGMRFDSAERLWVLDAGNQRYTLFAPGGRWLTQYARPMAERTLEWREGAFDEDGRLFDLITYRTRGGWQSRYARYDTAVQAFVDTVDVPILPPDTPFRWGHRLPSVVGWWLAVASEYKLWEVDRGGDTVRIVTRPVNSDRLARRVRDSIGREIENIQERSSQADALVAPHRERLFRTIFVDNRRHLWVLLETEAEGSTFDVFDSLGVFLGSMTTPHVVESQPPPVVRDQYMVFVTRDGLDAQIVVLQTLIGRVSR